MPVRFLHIHAVIGNNIHLHLHLYGTYTYIDIDMKEMKNKGKKQNQYARNNLQFLVVHFQYSVCVPTANG